MSEKLASPQPTEISIPVQAVPTSTNLNTVMPLSIVERVNQIRAAIERRAFELFMDHGATDGYDVDHWVKAETELLHPVHLSVVESDDAITLKAELPGFKSDEIQVSLEPRRVTISGKRESSGERKSGKTVYEEHCSAEILRTIELPSDVDASTTTATLKDGVLELVMPKVAGTTSVQEQAKAAASGT